MFEKHNIFHEVCWMSYCKIKMISKNQKYELEANSIDRSLANICVAGIGNFNERSLCWNRLRTLALGSFMSYFCRDILASDIIIFVLVFPIFKVKCFFMTPEFKVLEFYIKDFLCKDASLLVGPKRWSVRWMFFM